jgi:hypothetical protein
MEPIDPLSPDDSYLEGTRKTVHNIGVHARNGLRNTDVSQLAALAAPMGRPLLTAAHGAVTPTEEYASQLGIPERSVGRGLTSDMTIRAAGMANQFLGGLPVTAARAVINNKEAIGNGLRTAWNTVKGLGGSTDQPDNAYHEEFTDRALDDFHDRLSHILHPFEPAQSGLRQAVNPKPVKQDGLEPVRIPDASTVRG